MLHAIFNHFWHVAIKASRIWEYLLCINGQCAVSAINES